MRPKVKAGEESWKTKPFYNKLTQKNYPKKEIENIMDGADFP